AKGWVRALSAAELVARRVTRAPVAICDEGDPTHASNWCVSRTVPPEATSSSAAVTLPLIVYSTHHSFANDVCAQVGLKPAQLVAPPASVPVSPFVPASVVPP